MCWTKSRVYVAGKWQCVRSRRMALDTWNWPASSRSQMHNSTGYMLVLAHWPLVAPFISAYFWPTGPYARQASVRCACSVAVSSASHQYPVLAQAVSYDDWLWAKTATARNCASRLRRRRTTANSAGRIHC